MRASLVLVVTACSSHASPPADQTAAPPVRAATPAPVPRPHPADAASPAAVGPGDLLVHVEWHGVPLAARSSPGRTACGTAQAAAVAPTTLWGIPDVIVAVEVSGAAPPEARVVLDHCALVPRAAVTGTQLAVTTTASTPAEVAIARRGTLADPGKLVAGEPRTIELPIAGHEVDVPLEAGGLYELTAHGADPAWMVAAPAGARIAVTDAAGQVVLRDVPSGHYPVTAWLPPRAGQVGRIAHGSAAVVAGTLAEVTLDLAP